MISVTTAQMQRAIRKHKVGVRGELMEIPTGNDYDGR